LFRVRWAEGVNVYQRRETWRGKRASLEHADDGLWGRPVMWEIMKVTLMVERRAGPGVGASRVVGYSRGCRADMTRMQLTSENGLIEGKDKSARF
jgi:hypothetical protein